MKFKTLFPLGVIVIFTTIMVISYSISNLPKDPSEIFSPKTIESSNESSNTSAAYRQGYADGLTGNGLPPSQRASAFEFYLARGYNFPKSDYPLYVKGYNAGLYAKN